ncbi:MULTISPECIES: ABC transporter ATP-binding protein [unclassified Streptomyces]|uniref:ABC transporter ATP-binding protein n=1 Tax=unclassified Streptomyces TaxID=2593676 RepID=UPI000F5BB65B|nr:MULTISPECIES: ABC transporter ATP-binding protein [unclassified Streptomyces]MCX4394176.1 ABC transporter ATP-binding protein/permease [Streptomyces sp. NBC_01767]WSC27906.1 ABC transporter ATP-binding protein/permease [Streptomyces sp. NBC_01768]WSX03792.1 ABC transporter ATP-binding protein/permease [Streptomyces sp. NBC_00987]
MKKVFPEKPLLWIRVAKLLSRDPRRLFASIAVILFSVVLTMVSTVLLKEVVDVALPQHKVGLLSSLCAVMLVANVLTSLLTVITARLNNRMGQNLVHALRKEVYAATQKMPLEYFTSNSTSEVQTRIASDIGGVGNVLTFAAQGIIGAVASLLAAAIIMVIMSWQIALLSLTLAAALNMLNNRYAKRQRRLAHSQQERVTDMMQLVGDHLSLSGILLGRTMAREDWQLANFESLSLKAADEAWKQRMAGRTAFAIISMTLSLMPITVYWAAGTLLRDVSLGAVIVITELQARLSMPIQQLLQLSSEIQASGALFERIFESIDASANQKPSPVAVRSTGDASVSSISLDGLSFRYPGADDRAVDSISMTLPVGGMVFIVGASGSGKTTLALMLAGLLVPEEGSVRIDLSDGSTVGNPGSVVSLVPQESVLFNQSIRENLAFGDPSCTPEAMADALRVVGLAHTVERTTRGLDALVGERGAQMSGGERQRLALARSLLSGYPVMVIDEFSSGIDKETTESIFANLRDAGDGRTLIFITHRLPSLHDGDLVVTVAAGKVVAVDPVGVSSPAV